MDPAAHLANELEQTALEVGAMTPALQARTLFLARVALLLQNFNNCVVYLKYPFEIERCNLEASLAVWKAELYAQEELSQQLKDSINRDAQDMKVSILEDCFQMQDPLDTWLQEA